MSECVWYIDNIALYFPVGSELHCCVRTITDILHILSVAKLYDP